MKTPDEPDMEREEYEQAARCRHSQGDLRRMRVPLKFANLRLTDMPKHITMPVVAWVENPLRKNLLVVGSADADRVIAFICLQILERLRKLPLLVGSLQELHQMIESPERFDSDEDIIVRDIMDGGSADISKRLQQCSFLCVEWFAEDDKAPLPSPYVRSAAVHLIRQRLRNSVSKLNVLSVYGTQSLFEWHGRAFAELFLSQSTILNLNPKDFSYDDAQNHIDDGRNPTVTQADRRRKRTACL